MNGRKKAIPPIFYVMRNHKHVLSSCKTALGNRRYVWRHNRVLKELVKFIKSYMKSEPTISTQNFVSERSKIYAGSKQSIKHRVVPRQKLLWSSGDWEVSDDLQWRHYNYLKTIPSEDLRPDIVLLSIPYEIRTDQRHEYKTSKLEDLKMRWKKGYSTIVKTVEIGARGFVAGIPYQFLRQIGTKGR